MSPASSIHTKVDVAVMGASHLFACTSLLEINALSPGNRIAANCSIIRMLTCHAGLANSIGKVNVWKPTALVKYFGI